jgi:AcrR family transcriptional regulator
MPKIVDHKLYRQELLSKCFDLFAAKGYGSITMRQIAQGLGVSTGTLYHYFPNKKLLFEQLIEQMAERDVIMGLAIVEGKQSIQERMEGLGEYIIQNEDYFVNWTHLMIDFYKHQDDKENYPSETIERANDRYQAGIYELLGVEDPVLALFIYTFFDGLILERLWKCERVSITEQCTLLGKMITAYLDINKL